jgi:ubiquinone/menaquinone biosynthesis C-methylase UbiE
MVLTVPARRENGIWFPLTRGADAQAEQVWSAAARRNPINAAAATAGPDPFAKYPDWVRPLFAGAQGTLLDAGCGYGRVAIPLLEANPRLRCVGIDASPVMLAGFVELARARSVADRVELFCGTLEALPFPDACFDHVLSCAVLLHLPKRDVRRIVGELARVLVPGGRLVLAGSFPNMLNLESVVNIRHNADARRNGPVRAYTRREVFGLFSSFSAVAVEAHQLTVLPRSIGPVALQFASLARRVNHRCSRGLLPRFRHAAWLTSHHDVVAIR